MNTLTLVVYVASGVLCIGYVSWSCERYGKCQPIPLDVYLGVGIAGFSVFPLINTVIALALIIAVAAWDKKTDAME